MEIYYCRQEKQNKNASKTFKSFENSNKKHRHRTPPFRNVFIATVFFFFLCCRHRKDELERRMSALQESRRELMVQLEGLMRLLKVKAVDRFG